MKTLQVNFLQIRVRGELYDSTLVDIHCGFTHFIFARQKLSSTSEREEEKGFLLAPPNEAILCCMKHNLSALTLQNSQISMLQD